MPPFTISIMLVVSRPSASAPSSLPKLAPAHELCFCLDTKDYLHQCTHYIDPTVGDNA